MNCTPRKEAYSPRQSSDRGYWSSGGSRSPKLSSSSQKMYKLDKHVYLCLPEEDERKRVNPESSETSKRIDELLKGLDIFEERLGRDT